MTAALLPNAKQQFLDGNGKPLAAGTVDFYIPSTTTRKNTWQDAGQTIANTNPIILDSSGEAIIFGSGSYRQVVKDSLGNLIWDQITQGIDTSTFVDLTSAQTISGVKTFSNGLIVNSDHLLALNSGATIGVKYNSTSGNIEYYNNSTLLFTIPTTGVPFCVGALMEQSGSQSIPDVTTVAITFANAIYNNHSIWSAGNPTRLTVPAGISWVRLSGYLRFVATSAPDIVFTANIWKNGTANYHGNSRVTIAGPSTTFNPTMGVQTGITPVTPGDYFELMAFQATGGALNTDSSASPYGTWLQMELIQ